MCNFLICDCFVGNFGLTGFLFYVLEFFICDCFVSNFLD